MLECFISASDGCDNQSAKPSPKIISRLSKKDRQIIFWRGQRFFFDPIAFFLSVINECERDACCNLQDIDILC